MNKLVIWSSAKKCVLANKMPIKHRVFLELVEE